MRFTEWIHHMIRDRFHQKTSGEAFGGAPQKSNRLDLAKELETLHQGLSEEINSMERVFVGVGDWFGEVIRETMSYSKSQENE